MRSVAVAEQMPSAGDAAPVHSQAFNGVREPPGHGAEAQLLAAQSREGASAARRTSRRGARRRHHEQHRPDERQSEGAGHGHGGGVGGGEWDMRRLQSAAAAPGKPLAGLGGAARGGGRRVKEGCLPPLPSPLSKPRPRSLVRGEIGWRATVLKTGPDGGSGHCGWRGGRGREDGGCRGRINNSGQEGCE
uniref:Uncharacterized protein n=1 Tax=Eptatretus burgeri TaxID=7764 RepID=A0A8C4Q7A8_EPTBU